MGLVECLAWVWGTTLPLDLGSLKTLFGKR